MKEHILKCSDYNGLFLHSKLYLRVICCYFVDVLDDFVQT